MSAPLINFDEILAPISPDEPAGEDVRYSAITHEIEEARRADDASLPQGDWVAERKAANWPKVRDLAWTTLTTKSKDLQLACCLAEALAHLHGIAGIEAGLSLTNRLLGSFWQTLHPSLAEDGLDERGGRIEWLSSSLAAAMRATLITVRIEGSAYGLLDWKQSRYLENLRLENPTAAQQAIDEGQVPKELFDAKVAATPNQFYLELRELFEPCHTACDDLDKTIRDLFGDEAPSLSELRLAMEDCDTALKGIFKQKRIGVPAETTADDKNADRPARPASPGSGGTAGALSSRADALRRLQEVAEFFRQTEPHSPVSYLVQRAVKWGNMPLDQWLQDVIKEEATLAQVKELLGLEISGRDSASNE